MRAAGAGSRFAAAPETGVDGLAFGGVLVGQDGHAEPPWAAVVRNALGS